MIRRSQWARRLVVMSTLSMAGGLALSDEQNGLPLAVAPFDAQTARRHQQAWSKYLNQPLELTNSVGMKLVLIPPGEFLMGSPESETERDDAEKQHRVRITRPYYLGMYEVTQAEYARVMDTNPSAFSRTGDRSGYVSGQDPSRFPVEQVSWEEAVEFCQRLSAMPGEQSRERVYRLPTEAEWEYACRAGTITPFHFGSQLNGREANCDGEYPFGTALKGPYLQRPTTVGSYAANAFGLYDMHGNVCEWCSDWHHLDYYPKSPVDDPPGPTWGYNRVVRGGSWKYDAKYCRSADRMGSNFRHRTSRVGFRLAFGFEDAPGG